MKSINSPFLKTHIRAVHNKATGMYIDEKMRSKNNVTISGNNKNNLNSSLTV